MGGESRNIAVGAGGLALLLALLAALLFAADGAEASAQEAQAAVREASFMGVATCGGTTCHGRAVPNTPDQGVVRQDEILLWQDPASAAGAHSRAFAVLQEPRSQQIMNALGGGTASTDARCLGCHSTPTPPRLRGARFLQSDGVSCEACHGPASGWLAGHYTAGANHQLNVNRGLVPLENPTARAGKCLDCHFGNQDSNRFVSHRLMAAGHPRISFELDLFSTLQAHHDEDQDYAARKTRASNVQMWAIGQAMALERSLTLFMTDRGREGIYPEFYFLDCHSCHRRIEDANVFRPTVEVNRGRGAMPPGVPPYNDENMIMLSAAARVVAPQLGTRFDQSSRQFHEAMARNPAAVRTAAERLKRDAAALAAAFAAAQIGNGEIFQIIESITSTAISQRFTDYAGSVQAVMATDTLLSALVASRGVSEDSVQGIRSDINGAYQAVREPNSYDPHVFRTRLGRAAVAIRRLR